MKRIMIIPAAGSGSRLGASCPKLLFPVDERPMIDYLFDLYQHWIDLFVLVVNPSCQDLVRQHCDSRNVPVTYELQPVPTGMLDAILIPLEQVRQQRPRHVWITWCDQIAVEPETINQLANVSAADGETAAVFPTIKLKEPYIHWVRDESSDIVGLLQQREGENLPKIGESDMGLFCLSSDAYVRLLPAFARSSQPGAITGERNFLPFIPWLYGEARVQTFPGCHEVESVGINTAADLQRVEDHFRKH